MAVGLIIGIGFDPTSADFEELLDRGLIPESGFQFVTLALSEEEGAERSKLAEYYRAACVNQDWPEGMAHADALAFAEVLVDGRRLVTVQPQDLGKPLSVAGGPGNGGMPPTDRAASIEQLLRRAEPATLERATGILALSVVHERPNTTGRPDREVAAILLDQFKRPGWVPESLTVAPDTPVAVAQREDLAQLEQSAGNALQAANLADLAPHADLATCTALGLSEENAALGQILLAVLASVPAG